MGSPFIIKTIKKVVFLVILHNEKWYQAIQTRRSRRTFITKPIETEILQSLKEVIMELNKTFLGARLLLMDEEPGQVFDGAVGPYGKITGAQAYIIVVVNENEKFHYEKGGYIGQAIVLEAVSHGISTCWVGGYFNHNIVEQVTILSKNEKAISVIPIGYARKNLSFSEKMLNQAGDFQKRKTIEKNQFEGLPIKKWPMWFKNIISATMLAPTAYNRQSLRYVIGEDFSITIKLEEPSIDTNVPKQIDRGIAMLHIDVATSFHNYKGKWEFLESVNNVKFQFD